MILHPLLGHHREALQHLEHHLQAHHQVELSRLLCRPLYLLAPGTHRLLEQCRIAQMRPAQPIPHPAREDMYLNEEAIHLALGEGVGASRHPDRCQAYLLHQPLQADLLEFLPVQEGHRLLDHQRPRKADRSIHPQGRHHNMVAARDRPLLRAF